MNKYIDEQEDVQFSEPILAQKGVKCKIMFVERTTWKSKTDEQEYDAIKLTLQINDETVKTEHTDAKPRLTLEDQFNIVQYPYLDKKTGTIKKLGRQKLYQLEAAFGFDPLFQVNGENVEPFITRNGNKIAPKMEGVKRLVNSDFFQTYFNGEGQPVVDNWVDKIISVDIDLEISEQFGSRNTVARYVKVPEL